MHLSCYPLACNSPPHMMEENSSLDKEAQPRERAEARVGQGPADQGGPSDEGTPLPPRRKRVQVGEWPVTLAMVGALVGLFLAGLLVALHQAFPEGRSGGMNAGVLTGVSIAIIVATSVLGALMAGVPPLIRWLWGRARSRKVAAVIDDLPPTMEMQHGYVNVVDREA